MSWQNAPIVENKWQSAPIVPQEPSPVPTTMTPQRPSTSAVVGESLSRELPSNILGIPGDLYDLGLNTIRSGAQVLSGRGDEPYVPISGPIPGSEDIKEGVFSEVADRDDYNVGQRLLGNMITLGAEGLTGGVGAASRAKSAPKILESVVEPYITRPGAQIATDAAAGAGAGTGLTAAEESGAGPITTLMTTLLGGTVGGTSAAKAVEGGARYIGGRGQTELPGGEKVRKSALSDASDVANEIVTDQPTAVRNIEQSLENTDELGITDPTTGPASGDIGLSMLEVRERIKNPQPFVEKDQQIRTGVSGNLNKIRNPEADVTAPQTRADEIITQRVGEKQSAVDDVTTRTDLQERELVDLEREQQEITAEIEARRGAEGRASSQLNEQLEGALDERTKLKNEKFEQSAEGASVEAESLRSLVDEVNAEAPKLAPDARLPQYIIDGINEYVPEPGTLEGPNSTAGQIPADEVLKLRRYLSSEINSLKAKGDFNQADTLSKFKKRINQTIETDPQFAEANEFYKTEYAPFFGEGYGKKYRDTVQRGDGTGTADPEKMASFFLNNTSSAADDVKRIIEIAPDKAAADSAVEMYFDAMLAKKSLNPKAIRNFVADNQDVLPDNVAQKYENIAKDLVKNTDSQNKALQNLRDLKKDLSTANKDLVKTQRSLESGPLGKVAKYDSDKYVGNIMGSKDRIQQIDTIIKEIGDDKEALDGFKEATTRWLQSKVIGTDKSAVDLPDTDDVGRPIVYNKLTRVFDDNRDALAKIYTPEEMSTLNRMHKVLADQNNLSRRATTGSDTVEKIRNAEDQVINAIETTLRLKYGVLKAGGLMATLRKSKRAIFGETGRIKRAEDILTKMAYDPRVAKHVLEAQPRTIDNGKWVSELNSLISAQEAVQESNEE
jgi:hypothetical protein